jgi:NAD(P)-dependent dehydrogenase (short-subunit alcohol dehydrogenase family)
MLDHILDDSLCQHVLSFPQTSQEFINLFHRFFNTSYIEAINLASYPFTSTAMFGSKNFNPSTDIPSLSGKVIIVTGGNSGLGKESILQLSAHYPSKIYMCSRSSSKAHLAIKSIKATVPDANIIFLELDLTSLASIKKAAETFLAENTRLDILMNNAGIMATPPGLTKDGYEIQFGTNYLGHALFTKLLLPILLSTSKEPNADVRIINVSSIGVRLAPNAGLALDQVKTEMKGFSTWELYGQSKLANVLFTKGLAKRYEGIKSVAVHPGGVDTGLGRGIKESYGTVGKVGLWATKWLMKDVSKGALNQLWAATGKGGEVGSGVFYFPVAKVHTGSEVERDEGLVDVLWEWTEGEFRERGF